MTEILTLKDGTELYGYAEELDGKLRIFVHGKTMGEMYALLADPEKTERMTSKRNDGTVTYEGYTHLKEIIEVDVHFIAAAMIQA